MYAMVTFHTTQILSEVTRANSRNAVIFLSGVATPNMSCQPWQRQRNVYLASSKKVKVNLPSCLVLFLLSFVLQQTPLGPTRHPVPFKRKLSYLNAVRPYDGVSVSRRAIIQPCLAFSGTDGCHVSERKASEGLPGLQRHAMWRSLTLFFRHCHP